MNVASLKLSEELYDLSGWKDTPKIWFLLAGPGKWITRDSNTGGKAPSPSIHVPAYDLSYLILRLPGHYLQKFGNDSYKAHWHDLASTEEQRVLGMDHLSGYSDTSPENASCRLAIELFKAGVLTKEAAS